MVEMLPKTGTRTNAPTRRQAVGAASIRGFSIVDLLVSLAVMVVLIAIMMPVISKAQEGARRLKCASNMRQIGLALQMYAYDYGDKLPPSNFSKPGDEDRSDEALQNMVFLRVDADKRAETGVMSTGAQWDGLGFLFRMDYIDQPGVFYCPSHTGDHGMDVYSDAWGASQGSLIGNFHYRLPDKQELNLITPKTTTLVADAMRTKSDYNHRIGNNMFKADLSVSWYWDVTGELYDSLPDSPTEPDASGSVDKGWDTMDDVEALPDTID